MKRATTKHVSNWQHFPVQVTFAAKANADLHSLKVTGRQELRNSGIARDKALFTVASPNLKFTSTNHVS